MYLFEVTLGLEMDGRLRARSAIAFRRTRWLHVSELALHQFQNLFVSDIAGCSHHEMIRREPVAEAREQRIAIERFHRFWRAKNRASERMLRPEPARENFVKQIFRIVQIHFYFFEDNLASFLQ